MYNICLAVQPRVVLEVDPSSVILALGDFNWAAFSAFSLIPLFMATDHCHASPGWELL